MPLSPPLWRPSFRMPHRVRNRCTSGPKNFDREAALFRPCASSKLGKSLQTLGNDKLGGCGADRAATSTDSTMATNMGFVIGICERATIGRTKAVWMTTSTELKLTSGRSVTSHVAGRQTKPRTAAKQMCKTAATVMSKTQSTGARKTDSATHNGWTTKDHHHELEVISSPSPLATGPKALCTATVNADSAQVEFAIPISNAPMEERFLNSLATM
mmetsp:Transcript_18538/g.46371  ORF Transcript_18538/g.46371 Transcript_18538/m.46371 type:complete len:215 (-) Transcript_18538:753-1397(-)